MIPGDHRHDLRPHHRPGHIRFPGYGLQYHTQVQLSFIQKGEDAPGWYLRDLQNNIRVGRLKLADEGVIVNGAGGGRNSDVQGVGGALNALSDLPGLGVCKSQQLLRVLVKQGPAVGERKVLGVSVDEFGFKFLLQQAHAFAQCGLADMKLPGSPGEAALTHNLYETLGISKEVLDFGTSVEKELKERFDKIDTNAEYNQLKVIAAMQKNKVSAECFQASSGYGYNDLGRDTLERVYADCFGAEDALVRPQITCGTHALALALMSNLRPGDELLSPVGKPYDTLEEVIGIRPSKGSLAEYGITYAQVDLLPDGEFDYDGIKKAINEKTKLVTIQRSKGYATRPTLSVKRIGELIAFVKSIKPDVICMVDNCYGEFVEDTEPIQVGADMMVGSLIKNPGGGLAPIGGYIVGKKECVENAAYRLTSPGLGKEVGASLGVIQSFYQGFFLAPTVVSGALKGAIFAAKIYEKLGFKVVPDGTESRHDIIQAVEFNNRDAMIAFCEGIQAAAPVDSYVTPEPWAMPGYDSDVIMAAGAFVQGSSIELSADGPVKPPYAVYFQGGLTWYHAKLGILMSLQKLYERNLVKLD